MCDCVVWPFGSSLLDLHDVRVVMLDSRIGPWFAHLCCCVSQGIRSADSISGPLALESLQWLVNFICRPGKFHNLHLIPFFVMSVSSLTLLVELC